MPDLSGSSPPPQMPMPNGKLIPFDIDNITISSWGGSSGNGMTGLNENESLSSCHTGVSSYAAIEQYQAKILLAHS